MKLLRFPHTCRYESFRGGTVSEYLGFLACRCGNILLYDILGQNFYARKRI